MLKPNRLHLSTLLAVAAMSGLAALPAQVQSSTPRRSNPVPRPTPEQRTEVQAWNAAVDQRRRDRAVRRAAGGRR